MHVCRKCGNVVGSHYEVLSVLLSALWFYTIHNPSRHRSFYLLRTSLYRQRRVRHVSRPDPRVQTGATCGARQQVGGDCTRDTGPTTAWGRGRPVSLAPAIILHTPLKYFPLNIQIIFTSCCYVICEIIKIIVGFWLFLLVTLYVNWYKSQC